MKVVVVHNRYRSAAPSGENHVVDTETAALRHAGHDVVGFERHSDEITSWSALQRAALPAKVLWSFSTATELAALLQRERPDVVHVHNTFPLLTPSVLTACNTAGVPVVATLHNYKLACARGEFFRNGSVCHDCSGRRGLAAVAHGCYRGSALASVPVVLGAGIGRRSWRTLPSAYIFVSDSQRRLLGGLGLPPDRSFVKWNLVPRRTRPARQDAALLVYAGRLDEAKGLPLLMKGWDLFAGTGSSGSLRLAIAGGGPLESDVRAWAAGRVDADYLGLLDRQACADLLGRARAAVIPSVWEETFGLVAVEAMAAGVPVIAPAAGSLPELVADGRAGELFRPGDPADLARVLRGLDADPVRWGELGEGAHRAYVDGFDPEANLEQLLAIYRFAIAHPAGASTP